MKLEPKQSKMKMKRLERHFFIKAQDRTSPEDNLGTSRRASDEIDSDLRFGIGFFRNKLCRSEVTL